MRTWPLFLLFVALVGCIIETPTPRPTPTTGPAQPTTFPVTTPTRAATATSLDQPPTRRFSSPPPLTIDVSAAYNATFHTSLGSFTVELFPGQAPNTVNNFVFLARLGFYDGLTFHRVIENFMIQGGDPAGNGTGGPGYKFADEIAPGLVFDVPGRLAMANAGAGTNTNGSQFFVTTVPTPHLNGNHTIFGQVTQGQSTVDAIAQVPTDNRDRPLLPVTIEGIDITSIAR